MRQIDGLSSTVDLGDRGCVEWWRLQRITEMRLPSTGWKRWYIVGTQRWRVCYIIERTGGSHETDQMTVDNRDVFCILMETGCYWKNSF